MTTTSSFISRSATLVLFVSLFLLPSCVLIVDSCLVGMATVLMALKGRDIGPSRSGLLLSRARHRRHPDLLLRRIPRSIIREILENASAVGSKSIVYSAADRLV